MISEDKSEFAEGIRDLVRQRKLPGTLMPSQVARLRKSFARYADEVGQRLLDDIQSDFEEQIEQSLAAISPEPGARSELLYNLSAHVGVKIAKEIRAALDVEQQVISGAGRFLNQNLSPEAVNEYPALALKRYFQRMVPRGFKRRGEKLIPVPGGDWPSRWEEAGNAAGDLDWLPWEGDSQTGRGVALKSSEIWIKLGTLRKDTLGYPFPPFAFNSGFCTQDVSRKETEKLGLLRPGQMAKPAQTNYDDLFAPVEEASATGTRPTKV